MKQTLEQQIAEITKKHNLKEVVAATLGEIKHMAYLGWKDKETISIEPQTKEEFKKVLELYPATNDKTVIGTAADNYYKVLDTPYRVDIDNPAKYNDFTLQIHYTSNSYEIRISLPLNMVSDFVRRSERNITDSEHHYFVGQSLKWLANHKVPCYNFNAPQMGWYGGNKTLLSEDEIGALIDHLMK